LLSVPNDGYVAVKGGKESIKKYSWKQKEVKFLDQA